MKFTETHVPQKTEQRLDGQVITLAVSAAGRTDSGAPRFIRTLTVHRRTFPDFIEAPDIAAAVEQTTEEARALFRAALADVSGKTEMPETRETCGDFNRIRAFGLSSATVGISPADVSGGNPAELTPNAGRAA